MIPRSVFPTEVVSIRGLLVFFPRDLVVFVEVIICPDLGHILVNVALLDTFDPRFELICGDEAVGIAVDPPHYFTGRRMPPSPPKKQVENSISAGLQLTPPPKVL